ncbi:MULTISPECIES: DNA internalization-related competence protein ComEC/Rec2 [Colwellia]|uniref:DNA internalization-related competence protein ComEC/Rec2 n=1 Tax=Colwellia marinimaniae TaxID=1513592 RepID=A0ABQ0MXM5_9GAMM|nr:MULTISPECIES: DNA internalization-related competence protein ComEC/Rec2 [Colwellia]GAW96982.1 DNA internalization-related competence protein ComEC/Rec2 [Colwellia marinimaniae]
MDWWLLTFFLGAILSLFLPEVPAIFQLFLLLCLAIGFYCHKRLRSSSGIWFGACWLLGQAYLYHHQLPSDLIEKMQKKQLFVVAGQVLTLQVNSTEKLNETIAATSTQPITALTTRFNFRISKINQLQLSEPFIIRLSWQNATIAVAQGQRLMLNVKLKPAHGLANIGTFNYLSWLKANNIVATGYVVNPRKSSKHGIKRFNQGSENQLLVADVTIRQQLFQQYQSLTPTHQLTPILLALAFGERSLLNPEHWQVLQATGTSHLIAISGLHIGLLAGSAFFLVMLFFNYLPLQNSRWQGLNIRYFAIAMSILLATIYAYLAGFSLPTQRALIMLNLYWFSRLVAIKLSAKRLMLVTVFFLLIVSPFSLFTASFWLSFYAVAIIFVSLWRFKSWLTKGSPLWRFFKGLFVIQLALTVMLMPISALFFQQVSLVSLLANIIAVPWMSFVSIPSALISVMLMPLSEQLSLWFMMISLQSLTWLWSYLEWLSKQPYALIPLSFFQQMSILLLAILGFFMLYLSCFYWSRRVKQGIAILLVSVLVLVLFSVLSLAMLRSHPVSQALLQVPLLLAEQSGQDNGMILAVTPNFTPWQVVFFDVGQGLAVLIQRNKRAILYDTGAAYPSGFTLSEAVILPYLQYSAIKTLDKVILSHSDNDHAGGLKNLLENISIDEVISNDASIIKATMAITTANNPATINLTSTKATLSNTPLIPCQPSQSFTWQGLAFDILWPLTPISSADGASKVGKKNIGRQKNDDSCVILITDSTGNKLLLTGDISAKVERQLLKLYPQLSVDILQVPHHGSKTSSSQAFLRQLSPQIALVSAGYLNRWHMPVASVSQRYLDGNIVLLNSADLGQIIVTIDEGGISKQSYVDDLRPFWFSR